MILRFILYSILKNLRFSAPFFGIYLLEARFTYAEIGVILGCQQMVTAVLEIPSGVGADRWGRRRVLMVSFGCHAAGLAVLALQTQNAVPSVLWLLAGASIYGVGEALRTGSHKAIMLDYLDSSGQSDRATAVLALTRTFSKASSALAGLVAGAILFFSGDYAVLFWSSAVAAAAGCVLMASYPRYLEGETRRAAAAGQLR
ncbi:MAG: MFS transporter, partial [Planctomycetales bacterium]|nr:MFS transporter [Planctomycetales bacterium]